MLYALIGLVIGIIFGAIVPLNISPEYSRYTAVAILVILYALIGAVLSQIEKKYNTASLVTGLIFYVLIALFFVYLGDKLNIDMYLGVTIVFIFMIMQKVSILKDHYIDRFFRDKE